MLVVALTILTFVAFGGSGVIKTASSDLHTQVDVPPGDAQQSLRTPAGRALSSMLASDVPADDLRLLSDRASLLDQRSDRLLEGTAVIALVGMLVALATGRSAWRASRRRDETSPLASTSSNGSV